MTFKVSADFIKDKMENEVFAPLITDLSHPPPGWGGAGARLGYRGRASEGSNHPTRVIRRTDLRSRGGGGQQRPQAQQRPPRFSNLQDQDWTEAKEPVRRRSWGEVWRPEDASEVGKDSGQVMDGREESSSDEGEWKEVKKGRRNNDIKKSGANDRRTPPPSSSGHRIKKKSPEPQDRHGQVKRNSPDQARRSPTYQQKREDISKHSSSTSKSKSPRNSPPNNRRGSNSSNEDYKGGRNVRRHSHDKPELSPQNSGSVSVANHEELMKRIPHPHMMMVSDLPDEKIARKKSFSRRLSESEQRIIEQEENIKLQGEILSFLKKTWKEISSELKDNQHHWPPKVFYFKI